jgi:mono/diheme cytochrome c family protein
VLLGLSTGHAVGLALVAGAFVAFALLSALVVPRRWPQFPGQRLGWFIAATLVLFVGTLAAVEVFAKESEEPEAAEAVTEKPATTGPGTTTQQPPPPKGDPAAGKKLFEAQGCGGCHAFSAAGTSATIGPNLDEALKGKDPEFVHESIVDPNKEIAQGFQPNVMPQNFGQALSAKEIDDLVAFLTKPSS